MSFDVQPDKAWLTAAEAAAEQLPGCPSERTLRNAIVGGELQSRPRKGARGGGREFHWTDIPVDEARAEYLKRYGVTAPAETAQLPASREAHKDLQAEARKLIVDAALDFVEKRARGLKGKGFKQFCAAYQNQKIKLDDFVFRAVAIVTSEQLRLWERQLRTRGGTIDAMRDNRGRPAGGAIDANAELRNFIVATIATHPHFSAKRILRAIETDKAHIEPPALRTLQLWLKSFRASNSAVVKALTNPDKFKSHHAPAIGTRSHDLSINRLWELDASPADAMCRLPDGRPIRVKLVAVVDVFTRRATVVVSDEARGVATMALLRRAILKWGILHTIKTDNGKEFKNRAVRSFCEAQHIALDFSKPFQPQEKPHVERFFGTMNRQLFETLQGYLGHSVADRQAIRSRETWAHRFGEDANLTFGCTLTPGELQGRVDAWIEHVYEQEPHGALGIAPAHKAMVHADEVNFADPRALDALLWEVPGLRTVQKAMIRLDNRTYAAPELAAVLTDFRQVAVSRDPANPGELVVYNRDRTEFICVARDIDLLANDERIAMAQEAKKVQREWVSGVRARVRLVTQQHPPALLGDRMLEAAASRRGFDLSADAEDAMIAAHTPRVLAAVEAARTAEEERKPQLVEVSDEARAEHAAYLASLKPAEQQLQRSVQCDGYERPDFLGNDMGFWKWAQLHMAQGGALDARDADFHGELQKDWGFQKQVEIENARNGRALTA